MVSLIKTFMTYSHGAPFADNSLNVPVAELQCMLNIRTHWSYVKELTKNK
jgi:hypothetical protein